MPQLLNDEQYNITQVNQNWLVVVTTINTHSESTSKATRHTVSRQEENQVGDCPQWHQGKLWMKSAYMQNSIQAGDDDHLIKKKTWMCDGKKEKEKEKHESSPHEGCVNTRKRKQSRSWFASGAHRSGPYQLRLNAKGNIWSPTTTEDGHMISNYNRRRRTSQRSS